MHFQHALCTYGLSTSIPPSYIKLTKKFLTCHRLQLGLLTSRPPPSAATVTNYQQFTKLQFLPFSDLSMEKCVVHLEPIADPHSHHRHKFNSFKDHSCR